MIGPLLVYAALVASIGSVTAVVYRRVTGYDAGIGRALSGVTALSLSLALGYLGYQFVTTDYTNGYVWAHTIDYLPLHYRLSGVFADVEGAMLLWATGVSLVTFRTVSTTRDDRRTSAIGGVATAITAYFAVLVVTHSPFQPLELSTTTWITGPRGLNPLLVNPYMAVHPPITFAGYALTVPPFSIGVVHLVRRIRGRQGLFEDRVDGVATWLRGAWTLLTASVTLGALWSYYTLGWGGLWAWDPVQTASLIAWLLVTAALHAIAEYRRDGTSSLLAVSLATLSFPTVVLVRVVTQSGVFTSVHSFGIDYDRLLVALFVVTFGLALGLSLVRWAQTARARRTTQTTQPRSAATTDSETDPGSRTSTLSYGVVLLLALAAIYAWGVFFPVVSSLLLPTRVSFGVGFFNLWTYPLVVATLLSLGFYNDRRRSGDDGSGASGDGNGDGSADGDGERDVEGGEALDAVTIRFGIAVGLTILVALAPLPSWRFDPAETGLAYRVLGQLNTLSLVPPALYALGAELARVVPWPTNRPPEWSLPSIGTLLVHAGLVVLVLSVPFSYVAAGSGGVLGPAVADGGRSESTDAGYSMVVHEVTESTQPSGVSLTVAERRLLVDRVHGIGYRADALPETASGNVVVWGEITAVDRSGPTVAYRLGDAVWVAVDSVATPNGGSDSTPAFEPGDTLYAQGVVQSGASEGRVVETDSRFVGRDPVQAVLVDRQAISTRAKISVFDGDSRVARGWVGVRAGVTQGSIDVLVERRVLDDLYVVPQQIEPWEDSHLVVVSLERIPVMNGVRAGIWLLLLGGMLRLWRSR